MSYLGSIWYHSEALEVLYWFGLFFAVSYSKTALVIMLTRILGCLWRPHSHLLGMGIWEEEKVGSLKPKASSFLHGEDGHSIKRFDKMPFLNTITNIIFLTCWYYYLF